MSHASQMQASKSAKSQSAVQGGLMTVFDINFNLLIAKVEWNLGNDAEKCFWTGYMMGLRHVHEGAAAIRKIQANHCLTKDEAKLFRVGFSKGSKGKPTSEAAFVLDRIKPQHTVVVV